MLNSLDKRKVVLGISGGVDSTAAALLLKEKGYEVTGLFFDIQSYNENNPAAETAKKAAEQLGISYVYKNVHKEFNSNVIDYFCSEYKAGRTPNPCIKCNPSIKFKTLIDEADRIGAYYIATGHYADTFYDEAEKLWYIKRAANEKKDQSYMLYRLEQEQIRRLILPLNSIGDKEQVRQLAREKAMINSEAKDSQEICFIDENTDYKEFLVDRGIASGAGDFFNMDGEYLGKHSGIIHYTIGQRKGLGITLGKPVFVTKIDSNNNTVYLGDNEDLFRHNVEASDVILYGKHLKSISSNELDRLNSKLQDIYLYGKIRYAAKPEKLILSVKSDGDVTAEFENSQRAATPGQSLVFYKDNLVIGGGFISQ